jgi:hypothetical protein
VKRGSGCGSFSRDVRIEEIEVASGKPTAQSRDGRIAESKVPCHFLDNVGFLSPGRVRRDCAGTKIPEVKQNSDGNRKKRDPLDWRKRGSAMEESEDMLKTVFIY